MKSSKEGNTNTPNRARTKRFKLPPYDYVGCKGPKKRLELFCKSCRTNFRALRQFERDLDELMERAIQKDR